MRKQQVDIFLFTVPVFVLQRPRVSEGLSEDEIRAEVLFSGALCVGVIQITWRLIKKGAGAGQ